MASSARGLNPLLLELQAVLPQALKRCGGAAAGDGSQAEQQPTPGSDDDVLLGRLRTVLFSLLQSCIGSKLGAARADRRVTTIRGRAARALRSGGACAHIADLHPARRHTRGPAHPGRAPSLRSPLL